MNIHKVLRVLNIAIRAAFIVIGIILIAGYFQLRFINPHFRILVGIIFILYGIFRIVTMRPENRAGERP